MAWLPSPNPNLFYNPVHLIDQANEGASVTLTSGTQGYVCDGWAANFTHNSTGTASVQRVFVGGGTLYPFEYAMRYTCGTADGALGAATYADINAVVEEIPFSGSMWGTGTAQPLVISFWAISNALAPYTFVVNVSNASIATESISFNCTIATANVWQKYTVFVPAPPTSSVWNVTSLSNSSVFQVKFVLVAGSNYNITGSAGVWEADTKVATTSMTNTLLNSSNDYIQIGGIKAEFGWNPTSIVTPHPAFELATCQRFYEKSYVQGTAVGTATQTAAIGIFNEDLAGTALYCESAYFNTTKRTVPTITMYSTATGASGFVRDTAGTQADLVPTITTYTTGFNWGASHATSKVYQFQAHFTADARY